MRVHPGRRRAGDRRVPRRHPHLAPRKRLPEDLERFYNGYLFAARATEQIYNPELVLYFLAHWRNFGKAPREMLDINVKVDYSKLRMIAPPPAASRTGSSSASRRSERDRGAAGFSDLLLTLDGRFPDAKYTWLLELKYLKAGAKAARIEAARNEARSQLEAYLNDPAVVPLVKRDRTLRAATLVVVGMKTCHWWLEQEV